MVSNPIGIKPSTISRFDGDAGAYPPKTPGQAPNAWEVDKNDNAHRFNMQSGAVSAGLAALNFVSPLTGVAQFARGALAFLTMSPSTATEDALDGLYSMVVGAIGVVAPPAAGVINGIAAAKDVFVDAPTYKLTAQERFDGYANSMDEAAQFSGYESGGFLAMPHQTPEKAKALAAELGPQAQARLAQIDQTRATVGTRSQVLRDLAQSEAMFDANRIDSATWHLDFATRRSAGWPASAEAFRTEVGAMVDRQVAAGKDAAVTGDLARAKQHAANAELLRQALQTREDTAQ